MPSSYQPCAAAHPRWVSRIWPTFMRHGTPSGLRMTSTGVPSSRNGMSCSSTIFEMTPLLPWRPASLSPSEILRFFATKTRTSSLTPGGRSSPSSRENVLTSMTTPPSPCGHLQRGVADLARLLLEDRADQLLLGGQLGLALRRDLADEQVARADLGADADDAAVVEVAQRLLRAVRDVAGDLLVAELRRAGVDLVLLDVDRGELVVLHEAAREDDRVLEVVALPGHEGDHAGSCPAPSRRGRSPSRRRGRAGLHLPGPSSRAACGG